MFDERKSVLELLYTVRKLNIHTRDWKWKYFTLFEGVLEFSLKFSSYIIFFLSINFLDFTFEKKNYFIDNLWTKIGKAVFTP